MSIFFIYIFILLPLVIYIYIYIINYRHYINYNYILFICFFFLTLLFSIIYYIYFFIIFFYKNFRFYKYYLAKVRPSKFFFKRLSVYFLFWRYISMYLFIYIINIFIFIIYYIKNNILKVLYINNFNMLFLYLKYNILYFKSNNNILKLYNIILWWLKHLYNIFNFKEFSIFLKILKTKHIEDFFFKRNEFIKFSNIFYKKYPYLILDNEIFKYYYYYKSIIILIFYNIFFKLIEILIFYKKFNIYILNFFFELWKNKKKYILNWNLINIFFFVFNKLIYILIYFLLQNSINILCFFFDLLERYKKLLFYILLIIIVIYNIWIVNYILLLLYNHYNMYIPLFNVKESVRFFNMEWIDLRNYYNIILLHNTLIDLTLYNNVIYNNLLKNLHLQLDNYGFYITEQIGKYNMTLYRLFNHKKADDDLLYSLLKWHNKSKSKNKYKWFARLKKFYFNKIRASYKTHAYIRNIKNRAFDHFMVNKTRNIIEDSIQGASDKKIHSEILKRHLPLTQEFKNQASFLSHYYRSYLRKKIARYTVPLHINKYIRLKHLPFYFMFIQNIKKDLDHYYNLISVTELTIKEFERLKFLSSLIYIRKGIRWGFLYWSKYVEDKMLRYYFFKHHFHYDVYKNQLFYKHSVPGYNWIEARQSRRPVVLLLYDFYCESLAPEDYQHRFYKTLSKESVALKYKYYYKFIYKLYPYRLVKSKENNLIKLNYLYLNLLKSSPKILKKFIFLKNSKIKHYDKFHNNILENHERYIIILLKKLNYWDWPFIKKIFNKKITQNVSLRLLDSTSFIYYLKCNKYFYLRYKMHYNNKYYINLLFIKRGRKDFLNMRQFFIRTISNVAYHRRNKSIFQPEVYPATFTNKHLMQAVKRQKKKYVNHRPIYMNIYKHFRKIWNVNIYLTNSKSNKVTLRSLYMYLNMYKSRYKRFTKLPFFLNDYNQYYVKKTKSYKIKILNKINNLKRFFFFKSKKYNGFSLFNYLNSFSLKFHIKHLLWHSPYSFILINNNHIINDNIIINNKNNIILKYILNNNNINIKNYSIIFNLYYNMSYIKKQLAVDLIESTKLNNCNIFNDYYYYGNFYYYNQHNLDFYRLLIALLFKYYNNFIYKLSRYNYILSYKDYSFIKFLKRYFDFNKWYKHIYIRLRMQAYRFQFYSRWIKRAHFKLFDPKRHNSWRVRKMDLIPFWFFFNNYIKLFIYYLLKYYYNNNFFIYWWLNFKYNNKYLYIYNYILYLKFNYFNINIYKYVNIYFYLFLINVYKYLIYFEIYDIDFKQYLIILKYLIIYLQLKINLNIKKIFIYKNFFYNIMKHYLNLIFKIRNKFVYFKSNYYYFRQQSVKKKITKLKFNWYYKNRYGIFSFINSTTKYSINSFYNYTKNLYFLKNLYSYNINTYIFMLNSIDFNLNINFLIINFFSPLISLKYNILYISISIYIIYFLYLLLLYILYYIFKDQIYKKYKDHKYLNKKYKKYTNSFYYFYNKISKLKLKYKYLYYYFNKHTKLFKIGDFDYVKNDKNNYDYLLYYKKNNNLSLKYKKDKYNIHLFNIMDKCYFNFFIFYFIFLLPLFIFDYILWKMHLRGHILKKRRFVIITKLLLDNFKFYIKFNKVIGDLNVYSRRKLRIPKHYNSSFLIRKKKKIKRGFFFKWDRFRNLYIKLSSLGTYFYWFAHIDKLKYYISYNKYFFNSISFTYYYINIIILYFILFFFFIKCYFNKKKNIYKIQYNSNILNKLKLYWIYNIKR